MSAFWIVSYPKSGSTWLRALLTNYLRPSRSPQEAASINALVGGPPISRRSLLDDFLGMDSAELAPEELRTHLPRFHQFLAGRMPSPSFIKAHYAYSQLDDGTPILPEAATDGVVCIVRNPLDVALSYAQYTAVTLDRIIDWMDDPTAAVKGPKGVLPQPLGTWSHHVSSWLEQRRLRLHLLRYEDLHAAPAETFGAVVRFAGLDLDAEELAQAVAHSAFERLRRQEDDSGFRERGPMAQRFFRAGKVGSWRASLDGGQVRKLVAAHGAMMERFGYPLEAARAPLARG